MEILTVTWPSLTDFSLTWAAQLASLLLLPFANEDVAVVTGAYIVTNNLMPASLVAVFIYGGIVCSDLALYGLGAGARRLPWLNRFVDARANRFGNRTIHHLFELVALCRIVPGAEFVIFVACGWTRVPLWRFAIAVLLISALYLPMVLYVTVVFGDALDDHFGLWAWPLILMAVVAGSYARRRIFALDDRIPMQSGVSTPR